MAIVVSHIGGDFDRLGERALRQAPLADLIELRLDRIGHPGKEKLTDFCRRSPKPVIVTCAGPEAFGTFAGSDEERLDLLQDAAEAGARFVDVDYRLSLDLGEVPAPCHRIVSRHELGGVPEDLDQALEEIQAVLYEGDVTKLVCHAERCEEGLRLLRWLRTTKGIVSFASGEAGRFTRVLAPIFGSPFTYCAPATMPDDVESEATAPGQIRVNDLRGLLPPGGVSQETAILGVVGRPVGQSWSPWVQGMALKAAKLDAVYVAFEPESLTDFLALADDENYRGFSITAPFKQAAYEASVLRDEAGERTRAVNTLLREVEQGTQGSGARAESRWRGANTDVVAVRNTLEAAFRLHGRTAGRPASTAVAHTLVLGTGGAARAAIWAVRSLGGRVSVAGRSFERAQALAQEFAGEAVPWEAVAELEYDALVNATPVGSAAQGADELVVPEAWIRPGSLVLDAVYRPIRTPLLAAAHKLGCTPVPGGEWFVRQAVEQFKLFTHSDPDEVLMRKAFEHAHEMQRS